MNLTSSIRK